MERLIYLGAAVALAVFVIGAIGSILYDIAFPLMYPDEARKRAERRRQAALERNQRLAEEQSRNRHDAAMRRAAIECDAARTHLAQFYSDHADLLNDCCPRAMMEAFFRCEMGEGLNPAQLWAVSLKKIAELLPHIVNGRNGRARLQQIGQKIEAEIVACRRKIARLKKASEQLTLTGQDAAFLDDEKEGQLDKLRQFETQKTQLLTMMNERKK